MSRLVTHSVPRAPAFRPLPPFPHSFLSSLFQGISLSLPCHPLSGVALIFLSLVSGAIPVAAGATLDFPLCLLVCLYGDVLVTRSRAACFTFTLVLFSLDAVQRMTAFVSGCLTLTLCGRRDTLFLRPHASRALPLRLDFF